MSLAHILIALLIYCIVRAALRPKQPDPMAGRLVPRDYVLDMDTMKAEGSRRQRERDAFNQKVWDHRVAEGDAACAALYAKLHQSHQTWLAACQRDDARSPR